MKALVIGATGEVGKDLVNLLLNDDKITEVVIFVRKDRGLKHTKLTAYSIDFNDVTSWSSLVKGDVLFSCLGTTLKDAGSKEAQWQIDYDYQYNFAKEAKTNGVEQYVLVSAMGANESSSIFYTKMKGQLEVAIKALNFNSLSIMQPPILIRKNSDRLAENISVKIIKGLNALGLFRSQKPMPTKVLAAAMVAIAKENQQGEHIFQPRAIWKLIATSRKGII